MIALVAPLLAFALQDIREGTYTHRDYKVRFVASKEWTLKKGESDSILCEFADPKKQLQGWLFTMPQTGDTLDANAELLELVLKALAWVETSEFKCLREEKLDRSPGHWMQREYTTTGKDQVTRLTVRYVRREERLFIVALRCDGSAWDKLQETVGRGLDGFEFTDSKKREPEAGFRYDPWEAWNSFGVGSAVTTQPGHKGYKTIMTLKEKRENEIVVSQYSIMKTGDEELKFAVKEEILKKESGEKKEIVTDCRWCGKPTVDHKKPKVEEGALKIGEREVRTKTITEYDCKGAETGKRVYSTEVPGWLVQDRGVTVISFETLK